MQRINQLVEGDQAVLFRYIAQMRITGCCGRIGMTQQGLDVTKA